MTIDPVAMASGVQAAVIAHWPYTSSSPNALPSRRYVHAGDIAYDCEEFVVAGLTIQRGLSGIPEFAPMTSAAVSEWTLEMSVTIVRIESMQAQEMDPTPEALDAFGRIVLADGGALIGAVLAARDDGTLLPNCSSIGVAPLVFVGPLGGAVGSTLSLSAQL